MATTTTNFGWDIPQSTDLVKDGATAIAALGQDIDTALVDLKGGTTGQVLSKNSNTDLDFTWVAQDDSNAIQNALLTTTGDTIYASSASTPARLGIGSTGQVLTVSGGVPVWAAPAGGGKVLQVVSATTTTASVNTSTSTWADTNLSLSITPSATTSKVLVIISQGIACDANSVATSEINASVKVVRGSTDIWTSTRAISSVVQNNNNPFWLNALISITYLDSPATTSSTTYKTQHRPYNGANRTNAQWSAEVTSTITLMEIGA